MLDPTPQKVTPPTLKQWKELYSGNGNGKLTMPLGLHKPRMTLSHTLKNGVCVRCGLIFLQERDQDGPLFELGSRLSRTPPRTRFMSRCYAGGAQASVCN